MPRQDLSPRSDRADATDWGLLLLRLISGLALALAHGLGKVPPSERFIGTVGELGFPFPVLFAWGAGMAELAGGLLLAAGLLTRPASLFIVVTMLTAVVLRHAGDPFSEREKALLFAAIGLLFLIAGPGRLSLDAALRKRVSVARRGAPRPPPG